VLVPRDRRLRDASRHSSTKHGPARESWNVDQKSNARVMLRMYSEPSSPSSRCSRNRQSASSSRARAPSRALRYCQYRLRTSMPRRISASSRRVPLPEPPPKMDVLVSPSCMRTVLCSLLSCVRRHEMCHEGCTPPSLQWHLCPSSQVRTGTSAYAYHSWRNATRLSVGVRVPFLTWCAWSTSHHDVRHGMGPIEDIPDVSCPGATAPV
jgi:hypothetical protein